MICLDIDGTLTRGVDGPLLPGVEGALARLRGRAPVRLVTNTTSRSRAALEGWLASVGLGDYLDGLVTPALTARRLLERRGQVSGLLLADAATRRDYAWFREDPRGPVVLLATEGHDLAIADLQPAVRRLLEGAALYTLQENRYFRKGGELVTDLGPLSAFLSYASASPAHNLGKPSALLFRSLAQEAGVRMEEMVMVGDDAEFDASGAVALGMAGVLVRTGKYRPGDEDRVHPAPTGVIDSLAELPAWLDRIGSRPQEE